MPGSILDKRQSNVPKFSMLQYDDLIAYSRYGNKITARTRDGTHSTSDSVEANLLLDILKQLKKGR